MIVLNSEIITSLISRSEIVDMVEQALIVQENGDFLMPERMHVHSGSNTLLLMPCFSQKHFAIKLVSVYPENKNVGKPAIYGILILNDNATGEPLALMNASDVTSARTGALGALGAKYLAPSGSSRLGVVGAGVQGLNQAIYISTVLDIKEINLLDVSQEACEKLMERYLQERPATKFAIAESSRELLENSDVVVTATTANVPVLDDAPELLKGKTFIGIGSFKPEMKELPDALFSLVDMVYVDTLFAKKESGDLKLPIENGLLEVEKVVTLGSLIKGIETIQTDNNTRLFKSVGMALLDLMVAKHLYRKAVEQNAGTQINL